LTEPEIFPSDDDDDLFGEGMIVSAADVPLSPLPEVTVDEEGFPTISPADDIEPGKRLVTPPEEYDRVNATVAPDGTPLTDNQIAKPHLWRAGDVRDIHHRPKANRINVREIVSKLSSDTMLDPIEVLYYIMNANDESRHALGLKKSDRISANLRAKCAQELLTYMAPKLKSIEVKAKTGDDKGTGIQIFLPRNDREQGKVAEQPAIVLPEKDGVTIPLSPELAAQIINEQVLDEDEEPEGWMEE